MKFWLNNAKTKYIDMTNIETLETLTGQNQKPEGKLFYRQQIIDTPFWIIQDKTGYNLIMGKWKLNKEPLESVDDVHYWLKTDKWNIILSMIICATEDMKQINNDTNKAL